MSILRKCKGKFTVFINRVKFKLLIRSKSNDLILIVGRYDHLLKRIIIKNKNYRELVNFKLAVRTSSLMDLVSILRRLNSLMGSESILIGDEEILSKLSLRRDVRLDRYIINSNNVIDFNESVYNLQGILDRTLITLKNLKENDEQIYTWFIVEYVSIFKDVLEVLDIMLCVQLGVHDGERHWKHIGVRR